MYGTVPRNAIHLLESWGADHNVEVTFDAFGETGVAAMALGVIYYFQRGWCENLTQPLFDLLSFRHFFPRTPFSLLWGV